MRRLFLAKPLADIIGLDVVDIDINNPYETITAIQTNWPDTKPLFSKGVCIGYKLKDKDLVWLSAERMTHDYPDEADIAIAVDVSGSGIEIAAFTFMALSGWAAVGAFVATQLVIGLVAGFVSSKIAQAMTKKQDKRKPRDEQSYNMSGASNSSTIGDAVPLVFGRYRCGSVLVSQTITNDRLPQSASDSMTIGFETKTINCLSNDGKTSGTLVHSITVDNGASITVPCTGVSVLSGNGTMSVAADGTVTVTTDKKNNVGTMKTSVKYTSRAINGVGGLFESTDTITINWPYDDSFYNTGN
jgi:predicted phage tail protein